MPARHARHRATAAITVVVRPRSGGTLSSRAGVTGTTADPNPANNTAFVETPSRRAPARWSSPTRTTAAPDRCAWPSSRRTTAGHATRSCSTSPARVSHTIRPTSVTPLPGITQPVVIDGTTQPGYAGTPLIEISGENAGSTAGLFVNTSNTLIRGLAINRFAFAGIALNGPGGTHDRRQLHRHEPCRHGGATESAARHLRQFAKQRHRWNHGCGAKRHLRQPGAGPVPCERRKRQRRRRQLHRDERRWHGSAR